MKHTIEFIDDLFNQQSETTEHPEEEQMTDTVELTEPVPRDDESFDLPPRRVVGKITLVLLGGILIAATFSGGAFAQKHWGTATSSTTRAGGLPSGGIPSGVGGFPAGAGAGGGGAGPGSATSNATGSSANDATSSTAVIGTIVSVSGNTITVKNLGGRTVKVQLGTSTMITKSTTINASSLAAGTTVTVNGSTGTTGSVIATAVTVR